MKIGHSALLKALSPRKMTRAIQTFDRLTLWIIGICWMVTLMSMAFAVYIGLLSIHARKDAEAALVAEPVLPIIHRTTVEGKELKTMIDRLQRRYPEVTVTWNKGVLSLTAANGSNYRQWLMAIGQIDTLYPQFHWKVQGFCVGTLCGGKNLMGIDLIGESVTFEMPQSNPKN